VSSGTTLQIKSELRDEVRSASRRGETKRFPVKRDAAGRAMLNLACGTFMDPAWNNLDFSPYALLPRYPLLTEVLRGVGFLSDERYARLRSIDPNIIRWNLARGIPFDRDSFDVVYHSHFLEHLERKSALDFLAECRRVLRPGGILRIVVPDLELLTRLYRASVERLNEETVEAELGHEEAIAGIFDQFVRMESAGTSGQKRWVAKIERVVRGGAAKAGELHRWMYDQHSLSRILRRLGFREVRRHSASTSAIADWDRCPLDRNPDGTPCKPKSLYVEAMK
jgi:SAM-dependent methyltransferase